MPVEAGESTFYDLTDGGDRRDHAAEAEAVSRVVQARRPGATALLDVACGAGEYLRHLIPHFALVEGVATGPATAEAARRALPDTTVHEGTLPQLDLGRTYDVVACLHDESARFTLAGYRTLLRALARHLTPGGLLIVAPFWMPDTVIRRTATEALVHDDGRTVSRIERGRPRDGAHHIERHVLVADGDSVRHLADTRLLHSFARQEHLTAFAAAGCGGELLPTGLAGRPLLVGVRR
ncbi:class I SAM-dependent methyltransferase [Micromonospora sp. KLBMP9576]|uniref:class I SAM-dependent methyltransferase n=1 Tax=Micromonospora sp. KLBMP9576 TaxID=3424769 RepID=UPI003D93F94F